MRVILEGVMCYDADERKWNETSIRRNEWSIHYMEAKRLERKNLVTVQITH